MIAALLALATAIFSFHSGAYLVAAAREDRGGYWYAAVVFGVFAIVSYVAFIAEVIL